MQRNAYYIKNHRNRLHIVGMFVTYTTRITYKSPNIGQFQIFVHSSLSQPFIL